jgi:hypothetical protein
MSHDCTSLIQIVGARLAAYEVLILALIVLSVCPTSASAEVASSAANMAKIVMRVVALG